MALFRSRADRALDRQVREQEQLDAESVRFVASQPTRITGISVSMDDLVTLMVKLAIAAIPAGFILAIVFAIAWALIGNFVGGLGR